MPKPTDLSLNLSASIRNVSELDDGFLPALSPHSTGSRTPRSAPSSPRLQSPSIPAVMHQPKEATSEGENKQQTTNGHHSPRMTAMPELPPSPTNQSAPKHGREPSKNFFSNLMAAKSSHRLHASETSLPDATEKPSARSRASSKDRSLHSVRKQDSTPDLPRYNMAPPSSHSNNDSIRREVTPEPVALPDRTKPKNKSKLGGMLTRTKTLRGEESLKQKAQPATLQPETNGPQVNQPEPPPKTAPVKSDHRARAFASAEPNATRNRSVDRIMQDERSQRKESSRQSQHMPVSHSSNLLSNIQQTGKGVGDRLGKAGKGLFGKITRSGSSIEREAPPAEEHIISTINLPLVKQTRRTRIARRLELSKDKTEFWMPALPWRCIDYLNMNGCEEEGLYRIPGSGKDVKYWQRRFDQQPFDINLFEEPDLHDINTIGSMFKSWLRELPDEILPKAVQNKVAQQCMGATTVPQLFKDELSKLPPFNYYLLFAITCHLSLLTSFSDKNKMDYRNLCICFQPCLKIDAFCFQFLVNEWKSCWQGCWTEKEYLEDEYRWEREGSINDEDLAVDDRAVSSSGSSQVQPSHAQQQIQHHQGHHEKQQQQQSKHQNHHTTHQNQQQNQHALFEIPQSAGGPPTVNQQSMSKVTGLRKSNSKKSHTARSLSQNETTPTGRKPSGQSSHTPNQSAPVVPRVVTTPEPREQKASAPDRLPEVGSLSPIRL